MSPTWATRLAEADSRLARVTVLFIVALTAYTYVTKQIQNIEIRVQKMRARESCEIVLVLKVIFLDYSKFGAP
jgi:uncharacterized membrane protein YkvI